MNSIFFINGVSPLTAEDLEDISSPVLTLFFDSRIKSLEHSLERLRAMRPYDEVIQLLEFRRDNFSRLREFFSTKIKGVKFLEKSAEHYLKSYMTNSDFDLRKVIPIEAFASTQIGFAIDLLEKTILHSLKTAPNKALFQFETEYIDLVFRVIIDNFLSIILRCKEIRGLGEKKKRKLSTRKELKVFGKLNSLVRELRKLRAFHRQ